MSSKLVRNNEYKSWLVRIKSKIRNVQIKAAIKVNTELLKFYWELGADIVAKQEKSSWGDGLLQQLSKDLMAEFPDMKGFSIRNLKYIRQWYLFYCQISMDNLDRMGQQPVAQITSIPWGHNIVIITKCKKINEALFYVQKTIKHNWSRNALVHQMDSNLYQRQGKCLDNFTATLPKAQSDLAKHTLKDPYIFDFLRMAGDYTERDLEKGLTKHIRHFLLELGAGFAFLGEQVQLEVGGKDFFIDLLLYHVKLHCYVVVELKAGDFEPEYAGKLNFYVRAVDAKMRKKADNPTIGILICRKKNKLIAEYALSDIHKPIGVSEYQLTQALPDELKGSLPSIEEIEAELCD